MHDSLKIMLGEGFMMHAPDFNVSRQIKVLRVCEAVRPKQHVRRHFDLSNMRESIYFQERCRQVTRADALEEMLSLRQPTVLSRDPLFVVQHDLGRVEFLVEQEEVLKHYLLTGL